MLIIADSIFIDAQYSKIASCNINNMTDEDYEETQLYVFLIILRFILVI